MSEFSLILVDGNNFLYRAFHATIRVGLKNSLGEPTGAIKTYINMLNKLRRDYPNVPLGVVFDAHGKCFRHEMFAEYKANRKPMPDELRTQVPWIEEIIQALDLPIIRIPGVEADDVLGSYAAMAVKSHKNLLIASGDKDLAALVGENVRIIDTMKDEELDRKAVIAKYGVPPELIRDFLALKGDSSDNIPGMSGIGDVAASCLLNSIGDIDKIKAHLDETASLSFRGAKKFAEKFREQEQIVMLSRELATIKTDVPLSMSIDDFSLPTPNHSKLLELFNRFEFKDLIRKEEMSLNSPQLSSPNLNDDCSTEPLSNDIQPSGDMPKLNSESLDRFTSPKAAEIVTDLNKLKELCVTAHKLGQLCFYIFGNGETFMQYRITGIAISQKEHGYYVPVEHSEFDIPGQLERSAVFSTMAGLFADSEVTKVTYDIKRAMHMLQRLGVAVSGSCHDILLASHLIDSTKPRELSELSALDLDFQYKSEAELCKKGSKAVSFTEIPVTEVQSLAGNVVSVISALDTKYQQQIDADTHLASLYLNQEIKLAAVLFKMEENGVNLDVEEFTRQDLVMTERLAGIEQKIYLAAGHSFNISSPMQVGQVLFSELGMPCKKKSAGGKPSTSEEVLAELAEIYEVPRLILEYRAIKKLLTTYIEKLPKLVLEETQRLHGNFNQDGTVTGRLSSSDPNLQNIPVRTEDGRAVRSGFVARDGYVILACDYSQIELRILAHMADEVNMQQAFAEGRDIHAVTAAQMHGLELKDVTPELRRSAKAINFGLIYGMSTFGLAKQLHIENQVAKNYITSYFAQYPKVQGYMNSIKEAAHKDGYVTTLGGRRIYVKEIGSKLAAVRAAAERAAINAPIQGSAAEIIKQAMIDVDSWITNSAIPGTIRMIMQVHDELVFEVKQEQALEYSRKIASIMENAASLKVKLEVGTGIGHNWSDAH